MTLMQPYAKVEKQVCHSSGRMQLAGGIFALRIETRLSLLRLRLESEPEVTITGPVLDLAAQRRLGCHGESEARVRQQGQTNDTVLVSTAL